MSESSVRWNPTDENYPPKSEEGLLALKKQQEEEEVGFDPLRAAGLAAGASLLRNSGWRRTPMTLGEQIGHAIPAGMEAYYNQDALNQNEQQALYDRQQAESQALLDKQSAKEKVDAEKERATEFRAMLIESGLSRELKRFYMEMYADDPSKTFVALEKKLTAYKHNGFWHPMDTLRDKNYLENLWKNNKAEWKIW